MEGGCYFLPALSMSVDAKIVPNTLITPTAALANVLFVMPASLKTLVEK